jgi:tetratricopeptide (TPR) repeat protein
MKGLDQKFIAPNYTPYYFLAASVGLITVIGLIMMNSSGNQLPEKSDLLAMDNGAQDSVQQTRYIDEEDIILTPEISIMKDAPAADQVKIEELKNDFQEIKVINQPVLDQPTKIDLLEPVNIDAPSEPELIQEKKLGKEIYLSGLKLIDYTEYRSKPEVETKQLKLTGLSANKEHESSEDLESEWTEVFIPYSEYIAKSMTLFSKRRFKKSLSRFETILESYSEDINGNFYAGLCLYNLGEYDKAISHFEKCKTGEFENFDEEADWLKAMSYLNKGNKSKAKSMFNSIKKDGGYYADQAQEQLNKL